MAKAVREKKIKLTKTALAEKLGISRQALYYQPKREKIDQEIKLQIESVLVTHKSYGHKRIALELKLNKKRILRVMKKFNIKPYRRRAKRLVKKDDLGKAESGYDNLIKLFCPILPNIIWVADFTYIKFHDRFIYLSTVMDLFTREIIGWNISRFHNADLVLGAFKDALERNGGIPPLYFHSDQGSEYDSGSYTALLLSLSVLISMSKKASPWENRFQESFYSQFKVDLGEVERFESLGELVEAIHQTIYYYNNQRIHTTLKMSPVAFRDSRDKLSKGMGT
jgi:putative transposase